MNTLCENKVKIHTFIQITKFTLISDHEYMRILTWRLCCYDSTVERVATLLILHRLRKLFCCKIMFTAWRCSQDCYRVDGGLRWKFNLCQLILMWNCDRGIILSRNIILQLAAPKNLVYNLWILIILSVDNPEIEKWLKSRRIWKITTQERSYRQWQKV